MKTFREKFFKFKRINSKDFGLVVVSIGSDTSPNFYGIERSAKTENSGGIVPLLKGFDYKCPQITITMTKMDMEFKNLAPITKVDEYKIAQWLYGDEEFHPLQSDDNDDVIYYAACVKAEKYIDDKGDGYITATFQLDSPCAYTPVRHHNYLVRNGNEKIFDINCKTNIEKFHYPDVEFILKGNNKNVKITNLTLNETMEFKDLPEGSHIYCYNEGLKQIVCINDNDFNARSNFNKFWLRLVYGRNIIKVEGDCDIDIITQYKLVLP